MEARGGSASGATFTTPYGSTQGWLTSSSATPASHLMTHNSSTSTLRYASPTHTTPTTLPQLRPVFPIPTHVSPTTLPHIRPVATHVNPTHTTPTTLPHVRPIATHVTPTHASPAYDKTGTGYLRPGYANSTYATPANMHPSSAYASSSYTFPRNNAKPVVTHYPRSATPHGTASSYTHRSSGSSASRGVGVGSSASRGVGVGGDLVMGVGRAERLAQLVRTVPESALSSAQWASRSDSSSGGPRSRSFFNTSASTPSFLHHRQPHHHSTSSSTSSTSSNKNNNFNNYASFKTSGGTGSSVFSEVLQPKHSISSLSGGGLGPSSGVGAARFGGTPLGPMEGRGTGGIQSYSSSSHFAPPQRPDSTDTLGRSIDSHRPTNCPTPATSATPHDLTSEELGSQQGHSLDDALPQVVMSLSWSQGKLGAAFYDVTSAQVHIVEDKVEAAPDFWVLRTLFREQLPRVVVVGGRQDERLFTVLRELCGVPATPLTCHSSPQRVQDGQGGAGGAVGGEGASPSLSLSSASTCTIRVLPMADFKYELCVRRVLSVVLPGEPEDLTEGQRELYLRGKINTDLISMTRALGALLRYLDKHGMELTGPMEATPILGLHIYSMEDLAQLDEATVEALQVFSEDQHPAAFKSGKTSASKEGLSLYALLSRTSCPMAHHTLRRLLLRPVKEVKVLEARYDAVAWGVDPANLDILRHLQSCLRHITNVTHTVGRLQRGQLSVRDWKVLYKSLFNAILVGEICQGQDQSIPIFKQTGEGVTEGLYRATFLIQRIMDMDQSEREARFVVKPGVDPELDDKKRRFSGLGEVMRQVAELELNHLPEEVETCCIIYLPHVGYLLAFPPPPPPSPPHHHVSPQQTSDRASPHRPSPQQQPHHYHLPGLEFMFEAADMAFYKSPTCFELDSELGDMQVEIANHETRIMMRLVDVLLLQTQPFLALLHHVLMLDCLLSFSVVARECGWVRPQLTRDPVLQVRDGRHPLYELCTSTFVANPVNSGSGAPSLTLVTGHNASGKTVYLKMVGVVVLLAQIGSFVPATTARLRPVDAIIAVTQTTPPVTSHLSTFMVDLNRMCAAVSGASQHSLVIIDEFGASTYENDGAALLTACLDHWGGLAKGRGSGRGEAEGGTRERRHDRTGDSEMSNIQSHDRRDRRHDRTGDSEMSNIQSHDRRDRRHDRTGDSEMSNIQSHDRRDRRQDRTGDSGGHIDEEISRRDRRQDRTGDSGGHTDDEMSRRYRRQGHRTGDSEGTTDEEKISSRNRNRNMNQDDRSSGARDEGETTTTTTINTTRRHGDRGGGRAESESLTDEEEEGKRRNRKRREEEGRNRRKREEERGTYEADDDGGSNRKRREEEGGTDEEEGGNRRKRAEERGTYETDDEEGGNRRKRKRREEGGGAPHVFVSTHLLQVYDHLLYPDTVRCLVLEGVAEGDGGLIVPLYQVAEGRATASYAVTVAALSGVPGPVVERARQVCESIRNGQLPPKWPLLEDASEVRRCRAVVSLLLSHLPTRQPLHTLLAQIRGYALPSTPTNTPPPSPPLSRMVEEEARVEEILRALEGGSDDARILKYISQDIIRGTDGTQQEPVNYQQEPVNFQQEPINYQQDLVRQESMEHQNNRPQMQTREHSQHELVEHQHNGPEMDHMDRSEHVHLEHQGNRSRMELTECSQHGSRKQQGNISRMELIMEHPQHESVEQQSEDVLPNYIESQHDVSETESADRFEYEHLLQHEAKELEHLTRNESTQSPGHGNMNQVESIGSLQQKPEPQYKKTNTSNTTKPQNVSTDLSQDTTLHHEPHIFSQYDNTSRNTESNQHTSQQTLNDISHNPKDGAMQFTSNIENRALISETRTSDESQNLIFDVYQPDGKTKRKPKHSLRRLIATNIYHPDEQTSIVDKLKQKVKDVIQDDSPPPRAESALQNAPSVSHENKPQNWPTPRPPISTAKSAPVVSASSGLVPGNITPAPKVSTPPTLLTTCARSNGEAATVSTLCTNLATRMDSEPNTTKTCKTPSKETHITKPFSTTTTTTPISPSRPSTYSATTSLFTKPIRITSRKKDRILQAAAKMFETFGASQSNDIQASTSLVNYSFTSSSPSPAAVLKNAENKKSNQTNAREVKGASSLPSPDARVNVAEKKKHKQTDTRKVKRPLKDGPVLKASHKDDHESKPQRPNSQAKEERDPQEEGSSMVVQDEGKMHLTGRQDSARAKPDGVKSRDTKKQESTVEDSGVQDLSNANPNDETEPIMQRQVTKVDDPQEQASKDSLLQDSKETNLQEPLPNRDPYAGDSKGNNPQEPLPNRDPNAGDSKETNPQEPLPNRGPNAGDSPDSSPHGHCSGDSPVQDSETQESHGQHSDDSTLHDLSTLSCESAMLVRQYRQKRSAHW